MNAFTTFPITPERDAATRLLTERRAYPVGSPDWNYRTRAAWRLDQIARSIPAIHQTPEPPQGLTGWCRLDPEYQETAA